MNVNAILTPPPVLYPDSDGKPMAENTLQLRWITTLYGNLAALYRERLDIFVAADLLWYPLVGQPEIRIAPDALVVFGRPKGDRGSYKQWEEGGVAPAAGVRASRFAPAAGRAASPGLFSPSLLTVRPPNQARSDPRRGDARAGAPMGE